MSTRHSEASNGDFYALVIFDSNYKYYGVSDVAAIAGINDDPPVNANEITFSNIYDATDDADYFVANVKAIRRIYIP